MSQKKPKVPIENGHLKKPAVLAAFKNCANVTQACKSVDICRDTFYRWLREDPDFKAAYQESREQAIEALEDEAVRRAYAGSDTLLIFLLKGARPQKYRDNVHVDGAIAVGALEQAIARGKQRVIKA